MNQSILEQNRFESNLSKAKLNTGVFELKKELSNSVNDLEETVAHVDEIKVGSVFQKWKNSETKKDLKPSTENDETNSSKCEIKKNVFNFSNFRAQIQI